MALNIFSATDFRHNIVNSAILLLARIALDCQIRSEDDIASAVYIIGILEEYSMISERFVPEMYPLLLRLTKYLWVIIICLIMIRFKGDQSALLGEEEGEKKKKKSIEISWNETAKIDAPVSSQWTITIYYYLT